MVIAHFLLYFDTCFLLFAALGFASSLSDGLHLCQLPARAPRSTAVSNPQSALS